MYLGEIAPPTLRGTLGTLTQFSMVIGENRKRNRWRKRKRKRKRKREKEKEKEHLRKRRSCVRMKMKRRIEGRGVRGG